LWAFPDENLGTTHDQVYLPLLRSLGLVGRVVRDQTATVLLPGRITRLDPPAGSVVPIGSEVTFTVTDEPNRPSTV
jgi:beta-lactam-binding protein with PASTA domain